MRKAIYLFLTVLIVACSGDGGNSNSNVTNFNPPVWIQGIWLNINNNSAGFEFRQNEFCIITSPASVLCYEQTYSAFNDFNVYEEISNTRYFTTITIGGSEFNFEFEKISDNSITWTAVDGSVYERQ
jgi:hypothetical protein